MPESNLLIREATEDDAPIIAEHLCQIAFELGVSQGSIREDWLDKTLQFIERARRELQYQGFVAEANGQIVGSASCQILELYPMLSRDYQKGYIWGVYVEPAYRRTGIATKLMTKAKYYLQEIGCTKAVLHASETGKLLYSRLGYITSNEMVLNLDEASSS
ncbi:MAG: GNAT family N-acetyltransferase [Leptolyngbya sp. SIO1E4]|nr:GNAT family N-acetyltransferase [Leptolyngbya sp. SIO1E4]